MLSMHDTGYCCADDSALSPDESVMVDTDNARCICRASDLDIAKGQIESIGVWLSFGADEDCPEGMCFDTDVWFWVAHDGPSCITWRDAARRVKRRVALPAQIITNVSFGSLNLDSIFVTSAPVGMGEDQLRQHPNACPLFEVDAKRVRYEPAATLGRP